MPFWSKRSTYTVNSKPNENYQTKQRNGTTIELNTNTNSIPFEEEKGGELKLKNGFNNHKIDKKDLKKKMKKEKQIPNPDDGKDVSMLDLFRYADWFDKFIMIIGVIAALGSAGIYPLMFLMYGRLAGAFVDYSKYQHAIKNETQVILSSNTSDAYYKCFQTAEGGTNFDERVSESVQLYIIFGCVSLFCNYLASVCWSTAAERQVRRIRNLLFQKILSQEMGFFDKNTPGELNSRITSNVNTLQLGFGFKFSDSISMLGRGIACLVLAMVSAWKFSIVFLALAPIITACTTCMVLMIKKYTIKEFKAYGNAGRIAQEVLSAIRTVFSLSLQEKEAKNYEKNLSDAELMSIKKGVITGVFGGLSSLCFNAMFGIGIYYGVYLVRTDCDSYKPGLIMQSFFSMVTTTFAIGQALPFLRDMTEARGAAKSVYKILDKESEINVNENLGKKNQKFVGNIEFNNVHFHYPQRQDAKILKGLNLSIPAGKTVALCGSSGGGKSTVIQLLQRFYDPVSGVVRVDGCNIKELDLVWLRSQMGLVSQEPILFAVSIKENIRLGKPDATDEEVIEAAKQANAHNFIMTLNEKYDTLVGERGSKLSGGQKQRVAIARALIRNPKVLLLDEATSALDLESERIVQDALDKAKIGRTTIIIAHRLSTIRNADLIVAIVDGKVAEMGTHDELMQHKGVYHELVLKQTKEPNKEIEEKEEIEEEKDELIESANVVEDKYDIDFDDDEDADEHNTTIQSVDRLPEKVKKTVNKRRCAMPFRLERMLWAQNRRELCYIIFGTIAQLINGATFPAVALIFCDIYTIFATFDAKEQERESLTMMGIILGIAVAGFLSTICFNYSFTVAGARLTKRLRAKMFNSMLRQEIAWHDLEENRSSVLATRLSASVPLCKGLTVDWLNLISQGISGVGLAIIVALILNWKLALVMLCFVPINFISGVISARASMNTNVKGKTTIEEAGKVATECIENIKTVVSLGKEDFFLDHFKRIFKSKFKRSLALLHVQAAFYSVTNSLLFFVQATAFGYGFTLMKNDGLDVRDLYRVYATITFSSMILGRVFSQMPDKKKASDAAKSAFKIIHRVPKIDSMSDKGIKPSQVKGEIEFNDVHFRYPTRRNRILKGLSLKMNANQTTALVGQSGCGKSTTIQLLLRYYDVDKGKITLDGVDIRELNLKWLRSQIGLVSQEAVLFNCSIYDNICFGDATRTDITMDEVVNVSIQANIHQKITNLPDKYNTLVGNKGGQLSGGEKQRVAIARALIRKPKILLLDEATSALDTTSEAAVQDALDRAQQGRTCICIAHRLSTIQNAPKISVFKNGRVAEEGPHDVLMSNKNVYYTLQTQLVTNS